MVKNYKLDIFILVGSPLSKYTRIIWPQLTNNKLTGWIISKLNIYLDIHSLSKLSNGEEQLDHS